MKLEFDTNYNDWKVTDQYGALFYGLERDAIKALYWEFNDPMNIDYWSHRHYKVVFRPDYIDPTPYDGIASGWWDTEASYTANDILDGGDRRRFFDCFHIPYMPFLPPSV